MATYKQIQDRVMATSGFVPKTCWIAHLKADYDLVKRPAPNRISEDRREHPCPETKRPAIAAALWHFQMIK